MKEGKKEGEKERDRQIETVTLTHTDSDIDSIWRYKSHNQLGKTTARAKVPYSRVYGQLSKQDATVG